jgi:hypothetical protein
MRILQNLQTTKYEKVAQNSLLRSVLLLFSTIMTLAVTSCTQVDPQTPTLISVEAGPGLGRFQVVNNENLFIFNLGTNQATGKTTYPVSSWVRFTVPYPTSIELAINGKPAQPGSQPVALTKVDQPVSRQYQYSAVIENPGANPATWRVDLKTPFDVPAFSIKGQRTEYVLTIVDVSGSKRSQPLTIHYVQPFWSPPTVGVAGGTVKVENDHTSSAGTGPTPTTGPCQGGAFEQNFDICFTNANGELPASIGYTACSYDEAVKQFSMVYPVKDGWANHPGPCP